MAVDDPLGNARGAGGVDDVGGRRRAGRGCRGASRRPGPPPSTSISGIPVSSASIRASGRESPPPTMRPAPASSRRKRRRSFGREPSRKRLIFPALKAARIPAIAAGPLPTRRAIGSSVSPRASSARQAIRLAQRSRSSNVSVWPGARGAPTRAGIPVDLLLEAGLDGAAPAPRRSGTRRGRAGRPSDLRRRVPRDEALPDEREDRVEADAEEGRHDERRVELLDPHRLPRQPDRGPEPVPGRDDLQRDR